MRDKLLVIACFVLIFAFTAVDNAISPMVEVLHQFYNVPLNEVLLLISYCTTGIILGVFLGPGLIKSIRASHLAIAGVLGLLLPLVVMLLVPGFKQALWLRFIFGIAAGLIASVMWWVTYYGVSERYYQAMIAVMMAARPMAIALGVPFAGLVASRSFWQAPFWMFAGLIALGGVFLLPLMGNTEQPKVPFKLRQCVDEYLEALRIPYATPYYLGFTINRMCYFGFYSLAGIWFIKHYGLSMVTISLVLFVIGLGEAIINFSVSWLLKIFGHNRLFTYSLGASAVTFALYIGGHLPLPVAIALISVFVVLDRIYCMAMVIAIPEAFPSAKNKTTYGSLNTLTAWIGLTIIATIEAHFLNAVGLQTIQYLLFACFVAGSALLYYVQYRTIINPRVPEKLPL